MGHSALGCHVSFSVLTLIVGLLSSAATIAAAEPVKPLVSPNGSIKVTFSLGANGAPTYAVSFRGQPIVVDSGLGLTLRAAGAFTKGFRVVDTHWASHDERYTLVAGKTHHVRARCEEMTVTLEQEANPAKKLEVVFRAYEDGVAFRYVLPRQKAINLNYVELVSEETQFRFVGDHRAWATFLPSFTSPNEEEFLPVPLLAIRPESIVGPPLVIELDKGVTVALAEANLRKYSGLHFARLAGESRFPTIVTKLAPLPNRPGLVVRGGTPFTTPWRVLMIGDNPGVLIESTLLYNLSDPSRIADTAWIKPGKTAWDWWSGRQLPGVAFKTGMNNDTMKSFIDFSGEYGFEYMLIDARWSGYSYDITVDITRSIPEIDVPGLVAYGRERKVGVMLWLCWENVREQMDVAFPLYEKWGVRGIKVDLIDRKDQEIVAFYERVLQTAAKYHLLVDFHGAYAPTGEERTWPNLITREGVLGLEHYKWCDRITPRHNVTLPFTRMLLGPMDYTPGGFRNVTPETYASRYDLPFVMGTRAHQLAMFVVYDSPLQMVADTPSAYRGEPAADFLKVVPSTWDETRVLAGQIGEYVAIARRHGSDWFIGAMTDTPRKLELALPFLGAAAFEATVYADAPESAAEPTHTAISRSYLAARENRPPLVLDLARGGGAAIHLRAITDRSVPAK